jgi:ribosomal protein S27AE
MSAVGIVVIGLILISTINVQAAGKLQAKEVTYNSVVLLWDESTAITFTQYEVYQSESKIGGWSLVKIIDSKSTTTYNVSYIKSETEYIFKIRYVDALGSEESNTVTVTTLKDPLKGSIEQAVWYGYAICIGGIAIIVIVVVVIVWLSVKKRKAKVQTPSQVCPTCGGAIRFVQEHQRWYCDKCQKYL